MFSRQTDLIQGRLPLQRLHTSATLGGRFLSEFTVLITVSVLVSAFVHAAAHFYHLHLQKNGLSASLLHQFTFEQQSESERSEAHVQA